MNYTEKINRYVNSLDNDSLIKLSLILLTELIETDDIRYSEERNSFYWESCGDDLI